MKQIDSYRARLTDAETLFEKGTDCLEEGDFGSAELLFRQTLTLIPESLEAILNLGYALDNQGRSGEALRCYESVLTVSPEHAKARYNRAMHLLRAGNISAGFSDYEYRFAAMKNADSRLYTQPRWDGSPLGGRSILVYCEQGLGDAIQFVRYIPAVAGTGGRVILEVQQPLLHLLSTVSGTSVLVEKTAAPPAADCHIPLLSLPHIFGTTLDTLPVQIPYISPDSVKKMAWQQKLAGDTKLRVGLVWRGSASNPMERERSCPFEQFFPLLTLPGVHFYTLQLGMTASEVDRLSRIPCATDLADQLHDFSDTAALLANLDLLISVDTAVAHLAGALGKPVWILLAYKADWRWMTGCTDSPWYPTARLFRQPRAGDWHAVVQDVSKALLQLLESGEQIFDAAETQEPAFQKALAAIERNDPQTAITELKGLLRQLPDDPAVCFNLGRAYDNAGQPAEAEKAYRRALIQSPDSPAIWFALGELRLQQKAWTEAEFCLHKALLLKPDSIDILLNLGNVLSEQGKLTDAIDICGKILAIRPDYTQVGFNLASLQLRCGNYQAGFVNFESRLAVESFNIDSRRYDQPRWDGSPLNGMSILVYGEQGMGDVIQFIRYLPLVAERGGTVVFEVDPPLIPLLEGFPGIARIVPKSKTPPRTDVYIQSLSLPYIFGTTLGTVPNRTPYLFPDSGKSATWRQRLGNSQTCRIGIVWRGNPDNPLDRKRSCSLGKFAQLGGLPNVEFYSLQVGEAAKEATSALLYFQIKDFSALLTDFSETAALIDNLDLVIGVDTAVVHLAGALGKQVWTIPPQGSEWRWLAGREDTPWYPTMRIFEHCCDGDWDEVINRIRNALVVWLDEKSTCTEERDIESGYENGLRLKEAGNLKEAERCFRQIVEQNPELPDPQHSLGVVLHLQGLLPEAIIHYRMAATLDPDFVKAHYNLANACLQYGLYQEAIESAKTALAHDPEHADAHWLLGMLLLRQGDFGNGWREYEWRWKAAEFTSRIPDLGRPQWDGSPLEDRTLLIHMEQGRGDMIQFIRYAPLAAASGGRVIACAVTELVSLLATVEGADLVVDRDVPLPEFDVHIPVQSLPLVFGTSLETIPQTVPYLRPDPRKVSAWQRVFPDTTRFRIGLAWQGTPTHLDDHNRSCPLREFLTLGNLADVDFYSLQVGAGTEQIHELPAGFTVHDSSGQIRDFSDTAALIATLDLVISVDTAVTHLAGAMGKPVWTMLPFVPEWRWLLEREDTPWYPTMRLFRQTAAGDWQGLIGRIRQELAGMAGDTDYHNRRGIELLESGSAAEAECAFTSALLRNPTNAEALCNKGVACDALHRYEEAIDCYRKALTLRPDFMQARHNMGNSYLSLAKTTEARFCYEQVIQHTPDFVPAYLALAEIGQTDRDFVRAATCYQQALRCNPLCADALQGLAETYHAQEQFEEAIPFYKKALELEPRRINALNMMGSAFHCLERLPDAEQCYRMALSIDSERVTVLNNLGVVLNAQGRLTEAVAVYHRLLEIEPDYAEGHWNLSVALLALGDYAGGWPEFEWRFRKANPVPSRSFSQPQWDGSDLGGKTILLHTEQGFGDTIQFARYVPLVAQRGGQVVVECQVHALKQLLLSLTGATTVIVAGEPLPDFDCHLPLLSLPLLFGTTVETVPAPIPYLHPEISKVELWKQRLGTTDKMRVGIVWFAKQSQVLNRKRSCHLRHCAPLWKVSGTEFYSLQIGPGSEQLAEFDAGYPLIDLTSSIGDFSDTAALMANLDLIISIDTAAAHLAGALGIKTWVILPHVAEWRWLCNRTDSPWYPTMRLFRQPAAGDWSSLMGAVAEQLRSCVEHRTPAPTIQPAPSRLTVGLAWSGRQNDPHNRKRSCPFSSLALLFDLPDITFVQLQLDSTAGHDTQMIDLTGQIQDFEDTAALMANLDLVISIDTAVAHLAAATGRQTWVLLPFVADWRWRTHNDKPLWYPHVLIFRQARFGDWDSVVQNVATCLRQFPEGSLVTHNRGQALTSPDAVNHEVLELEQQLCCHIKELTVDPANTETLLSVGAALALLGRNDEAIAACRGVLELDAEHIAGHLNLAYLLLAAGKYQEGWQHFEYRLLRIPKGQIPPWPMLQPSNVGTHPAGTLLLVHCEQGFGDTIQFCRFLPLLADIGYRVVVSCQPSLATLIASVRGVNRVIEHGSNLPVCQFQILMLSLPYLFHSSLETIPQHIPYMAPRAPKIEKWSYILKNVK